MSDYFKTLREPILSNKKRDKVIEQLKENQQALTSFFNKMIEAAKPRQQLPAPSILVLPPEDEEDLDEA